MGESDANLNRHVSVSKDLDPNGPANPIYVHVVNQAEVTDAIEAQRVILQAALEVSLQSVEDAITTADSANVAALEDARDQIVAAIASLEAANDASGDDIVTAIGDAQTAIEAALASLEAEVTLQGTNIVAEVSAAATLIDGSLNDIEALLQSEFDQTQVLLDDIKTAEQDTTYAEDTPHTTGDEGKFVFGIATDGNTTLVNALGDYVGFSMDAKGRQHVLLTDSDGDIAAILATGAVSTDKSSVAGQVIDPAAGVGDAVGQGIHERVIGFNMVYNGTTWERVRAASPTANPTTGVIPAMSVLSDGSVFRRPFTASAEGDGSVGTTFGNTGIRLYNGTTYDRWRSAQSIDAQAFSVGVPAAGIQLGSGLTLGWGALGDDRNGNRELSVALYGFDGVDWDRLRTAQIADGFTGKGLLADGLMGFNGTSWDRLRTVGVGDGAGTGLLGQGMYGYRSADGNWKRVYLDNVRQDNIAEGRDFAAAQIAYLHAFDGVDEYNRLRSSILHGLEVDVTRQKPTDTVTPLTATLTTSTAIISATTGRKRTTVVNTGVAPLLLGHQTPITAVNAIATLYNGDRYTEQNNSVTLYGRATVGTTDYASEVLT